MVKPVWLLALLIPFLLAACGNDEAFQGRFISPDGNSSYTFQPDGTLEIIEGEEITTAQYKYKSSDQLLTLKSGQDLPSDKLTVKEDGNLQSADMTLTRSVDYAMLDDSTWIGDQGQHSFALTFTLTDQGMETFSELVSYYDEAMVYLSQTDDSITRLSGNQLLLDQTQYFVSEVTETSFKLTIGENSMVFEKHPKGTDIEIREGYQQLTE